ncbi:hypothetical protein K1T71_001076 [Dendrolimus kikuchii]|uniref:Uncharacterized protein n=1 Tax=Dendrolimus kikuchii TaxID=765133 RepID=A0ACC1DH06_9NEOP|nr:hypothetical protein K1T71_001076 [Dendrolimus kikuchii]
MFDPTPRNVKSVKSRQDTISQADEAISKRENVPKVHSHFLVSSEKLDKVTRRVIAPYAQIERKGLKDEEEKAERYLDINRFNVFLEDTVDLDSLLYETALVLKTITESSGVFVYIVDKLKNEIVLMPHNTKNPARHEVNIPIEEGKVAAAHVAFTKEFLLLEDVPQDKRFSEGLKWVDAKVALCMPIVKPDGDCHAVLELFRTYAEPYSLHRDPIFFLSSEVSSMHFHNYLAVVKSFIGAMRSSFYIIDKDHLGDHVQADMWDDGWSSEKTTMPRKKVKINLSIEQSPAGLVARTGEVLNVRDAYKDSRFVKEIDPTSGTVVRSCLVAPITDKHGVIGVVQLINKTNTLPFDAEDELIFDVFVSYCSLIVHFYNMQQQKIYHENKNKVLSDLMRLHLKPCKHEIEDLMETNGVVVPPSNFKSYDYHISEGSKEEMPGLICYMYTETFAERNFERTQLADFALTILHCYRNNPYHNAEHAFCFTHTMYLILVNNSGYFDFVETAALMLAGLCHDLDHPGFNNNFLTLIKHPLSLMYKSSLLEYHHYYLAKKIIEDKNILAKLPTVDQERILKEVKYNILCTDLAVYFQVRAQLTPLLADHTFDWTENAHRRMLKGILMTTSDLSGVCKPFGVSKAVAESVYEEFYNQGDRERAMGYSPLSMMDRRRSINQPAEQIQFLSVVVLPCLLLLQNIFPNTSPLTDNCRKTQEAWREEIDIRGQKLWRQDDSVPTAGRSKYLFKPKFVSDV